MTGVVSVDSIHAANTGVLVFGTFFSRFFVDPQFPEIDVVLFPLMLSCFLVVL